jgi:hypothetical protein
MADHVLRGGKPGYDRLLLLARDRWADTRALLERTRISPGMGGGVLIVEDADFVWSRR